MTASATVTSLERDERIVSISQERLDEANSAAYQIELVSGALHAHIKQNDDTGEMTPVATALHLRVLALTSAIAEITDIKNKNLERPLETIRCEEFARLVNRA